MSCRDVEYRTFSVEVAGGPRGPEVRVVDSPAGQRGRAPFVWPLDEAELGRLAALFEAAAREPEGPWERNLEVAVSGPGPDPGRSPARRPIEEAGARLFHALFAGPVRDRLLESLIREPKGRDRGVRIELRLDLGASDLGADRSGLALRLHRLPWELLYRPGATGFLALDPHTPVVRLLEGEGGVEPSPARSLHVLAVAPEPAGLPPLDLAAERRRLQAEAPSWWRGVRVSHVEPPTLEALVEACREEEVHVLHFMGHGTFDEASGAGALVFEDEHGRPDPVGGPRLARQLARFVPPLRFVFLNACRTAAAAPGAPFSGVATALSEVGVPAILAMQYPVSDRAAIELSRTVYRELARGRPVEAAVAEGRLAIDRTLRGSPEWATPVLFLRAPDGRLFTGALPGRRRRLLAGAAALALAASLAAAGAGKWGGDRRWPWRRPSGEPRERCPRSLRRRSRRPGPGGGKRSPRRHPPSTRCVRGSRSGCRRSPGS